MGDRTRRSLGARRAVGLLVVALAASMTGCGVSTSPEPADEGDAAVAESISPGVTRTPPTADATRSPRDLVIAFFQTAAGGGEDAVRRAKEFLVPGAQAKWQPGQPLLVVRIVKIDNPVPEAGGKSKVTVRYRQIGTMAREGWLVPRDQGREFSFPFIVVPREAEPGQFRLQNPPSELMISDETLEEYYRSTSIYFWDTTKTRLVPDLRYLALTAPAEQRPNQVVEWLLRGPSPWLNLAVDRFNEGTTQKGVVAPRSTGPLVVNLSSTAASDEPGQLQRIVDQLRWSLRPYITGPVELQIEGQKKVVDGSSEAYLKANVAARPRPSELFGVKNGHVVPHSVTTRLMPVLNARANARVESAAMSDDLALAAFVHGRAGALALTVVSVNEDKTVERPARGLASPLGRPAWIPGPGSPRFLISAGGKLYAVSGTGASEEITVSGSGDITSVSVAPDGRRVALVANDKAYVAALSIGGAGIGIGQLRRIVPERLTAAAIAWMSEDQVVVAGRSGGNAALFQSTADGAIAKDVSPKDQVALTNVVALPDGQNVLVLQTQAQSFFFFPSSRTPDYSQALPDSPFYAG